MLQIINQHKAQRNTLLFANMVSDAQGKQFLFANDAKGTEMDTVRVPKKQTWKP